MKRRARRMLSELARASGATALTRRVYRHRLAIICYHGICESDRSSHWLLHPRRSFEREISFLSEHYEVRPIDEALDDLHGPGLSRPTASITFDDGYANNLTVALPVLRRYGLPATVYLTTSLISSHDHLWTTRIEFAVRQTHRGHVDIGDERVDGPVGETLPQRTRRGQELKEVLKTLPGAERRDLIAAMLDQLGPLTGLEPFRLLTPTELRSLDCDGGVTFGGHTRTHPILSGLSDEDIEAEVLGSIEDVRDLDHVSNTFAYPNGRPGDYDERTIRLLRENGIRAGLSTRQGLHDAAHDPFHARRVVVDGSMSFSGFVTAVSGLKELVSR